MAFDPWAAGPFELVGTTMAAVAGIVVAATIAGIESAVASTQVRLNAKMASLRARRTGVVAAVGVGVADTNHCKQ